MDSTQEKSKVSSTKGERPGARQEKDRPRKAESPTFEPPAAGPPELIMLKAWIRENQTTALAGAFVVGSLIGFWLRK